MSVRRGQAWVWSILGSLELPTAVPVFIFENTIATPLELIKCRPIRTVVDRICPKPRPTKEGLRVDCEPTGSVIACADDATCRGLFGQNYQRRKDISIESIDDVEYEFYHKRKRYLVNGVHLVTALHSCQMLEKMKIPPKEWGGQYTQLTNRTMNVEQRRSTDTYIAGQIIRLLLETHSGATDYELEREFHALKAYSEGVQGRMLEGTESAGQNSESRRQHRGFL